MLRDKGGKKRKKGEGKDDILYKTIGDLGSEYASMVEWNGTLC